MEKGIDKQVMIERSRSSDPESGCETNVKKRHYLGWILVCVLALLMVGAIGYIGPLEILQSIVISFTEDTEYAPGYSERAFRNIAIGDTEQSVRTSLGSTLSESKAEPYVSWLYAPNPAGDFEKDGKYPDMRFSFTSIEFGEDGTFSNAFGQISNGSSSTLLSTSSSGSFGDGVNTLAITDAQIKKLKDEKATTDKIEALFGKPQAIFKSDVVKWLIYSRSPGSKNYRQRKIGIDKDGKVCRKVAEIWWD